MSLWQQYRRAEIGPVTVEDLEMDVRVSNPENDTLEFDLTVYNLATESWQRIEDRDDVVIELGWVNGPSSTVINGEMDTRSRTFDDGDVAHRFSGVDYTGNTVAEEPPKSKSWSNARPDEIVSDIASMLDLTSRTRQAPTTIDNFVLENDELVSRQLRDLIDHVEEQTNEMWRWDARRGQIIFIPTSETLTEVPDLSYDSSLISLSPADEPDDTVTGKLEFEAMLDPRIQADASVWVDTENQTGEYRIDSYEYQSSSVDGTHLVRGKISPLDADFSTDK